MTIYVNEGFRPPSSSQAATRPSFAALIGRMSQTAPSGTFASQDLEVGRSIISVFGSQFWQIQTVYFKAVFLAIDLLAFSLFKVINNVNVNNVNVDGIEVSSFWSECALFECVLIREYILCNPPTLTHV